ncbi:hypothetical protein CFP56_028272 [Quercus suber]|uniref:Uncharacterized protein n=1 Tax=Quercus suber TaxID=58331 RepID=A0AAW0LWB2_QUESU
MKRTTTIAMQQKGKKIEVVTTCDYRSIFVPLLKLHLSQSPTFFKEITDSPVSPQIYACKGKIML